MRPLLFAGLIVLFLGLVGAQDDETCRWVCDGDDDGDDGGDCDGDDCGDGGDGDDGGDGGGGGDDGDGDGGECACPTPPPEDVHSCAVWISGDSVFRMGTGTIISQVTVMTSAHLLTLAHGDVSLVQVQYYEDSFDSDILTVRPIMIVVHTSYNPLTGINDIAMIRFEAATFPLNNVVSIQFEAQPLAGVGFVAGFGEDSTGTISRIPLRVSQTIVECTDEVLESSESHICASDANVRMCAGQNGGGLCIEADGKRSLVGIVSRIRSGCLLGQQTGFTSLQSQESFLSMFVL